jgi:hypothetical protein
MGDNRIQPTQNRSELDYVSTVESGRGVWIPNFNVLAIKSFQLEFEALLSNPHAPADPTLAGHSSLGLTGPFHGAENGCGVSFGRLWSRASKGEIVCVGTLF